jgi:spore coat protein CotF
MPTLLNAAKVAKKQMDDQTIANDMLMGTKAAASSYLMAALETATPELRQLYVTFLGQIINEHSALTHLAITRNWYKPYDVPVQQLNEALMQSQNVVSLPKA